MVEDQQREERSGQPNLMNMNVYEPCDDEINETGKQSIRLSDEVHPTPNIQWPTIGEFTPEQGLKKIEEYIKVSRKHGSCNEVSIFCNMVQV